MNTPKQELLQKLTSKGVTVPQAAETVGIDPQILKLYLADDAFPVPTRILNKLAEMANQ